MIALPQGPFDVIVADPPWRYASRDGGGRKTKFGPGAMGHYPTMGTEDICRLEAADCAAPDSLLFLWACWPMLADGMRVIEAWGFEYVTIGFVWVKTDPRGGSVFLGPGFYAKANSEPCLLARRGKTLKPAVDDVSSVIVSPRREHSRKPEAARTRIDRMYPNARKVELFCRESAEGWTAWGNQVDQVFARQQKLFTTSTTTARADAESDVTPSEATK